MTYKLLILLIITLNYQNLLAAFVGQNCTIDSKNGICKLLKDCPRAIDELNHESKLYTKCTPEPDYVGIQPIVCCFPTQAEIDEIIPEEWLNVDISERSIFN